MDTVEESRSLTMQFLKKHGYLDGFWRSGVITWTSSFGNKNSISIEANTGNEFPFVRLKYTNTDYSGEKHDMDYKAQLTFYEPPYGGKRWSFICPLVRDGIPCRKRVRALYQVGRYFGCRKCAGLVYDSQTTPKRFRGYPWGVLTLDVYLRDKVNRTHYAGKPTKKYKTYLKKMRRFGRYADSAYRDIDDFLTM
tara:strand:- start:756 stop:1337 length:582 start_codon:yes stop_codon:yes gene_type:complete